MAVRSSQIAAATALAICATIGGGGYVLAQQGPPHHAIAAVGHDGTDAVVPWLDRPATPPPPPSPPPTPAPAYPACTAGQLTAHPGFVGAAAGTMYSQIELTDASTRPCTLTGFPTSLTGIRADGTQVALHPHQDGSAFATGESPGNLHRGEKAKVVLVTGDNCDALNQPTPKPDRFVGEVIGLPGGGQVSAAQPFDAACGVGVGELGVPAPPTPDPDAYHGLTAAWNLPATAAAGSLLQFTVTLTNTDNTAVPLDPCPVYQEGIYTRDGGHSYTYELNCDTVHAIQPHQTVTYAMQLPTPASSGLAKIGWSIPAGSLFQAAAITIT